MRKVQGELAGHKKDIDRLLDSLSPTNREFVDEKLVGIKRRLRELEARQKELETVAEGPLDLETATAQALAQVERFREALAHGSITEQKEFLRGMIAEIILYPSQDRGIVRYYDLLPASFKCHGGTGDEPEWQPRRLPE